MLFLYQEWYTLFIDFVLFIYLFQKMERLSSKAISKCLNGKVCLLLDITYIKNLSSYQKKEWKKKKQNKLK